MNFTSQTQAVKTGKSALIVEAQGTILAITRVQAQSKTGMTAWTAFAQNWKILNEGGVMPLIPKDLSDPVVRCGICDEEYSIPLDGCPNQCYRQTRCTRGHTMNRPNLKHVPFVAVRRAVMRASQCEATARSATMAQRIANALNKFQPGERGK